MVTRFNRDHPAKNLPDAYCKHPESNNAKILEVERCAVSSLREATRAIYDSLDISAAYGRTLDLYGEMLGQQRGAATDEQYRVLIKSRIARNLSGADHASIIHAICATFGCEPTDVLLAELDTPCKVELEGLPISQLNASNIDINTAVQIITSLMPAGVFVEALSFSGTFEFGTESMEYDESAGFADEEQTMGGYLGLVSDGSGSNLPV